MNLEPSSTVFPLIFTGKAVKPRHRCYSSIPSATFASSYWDGSKITGF